MKSTTQTNTDSSKATLMPARDSRKVLANPITPPLACAVFLWAVLGLGITQPALAQGYLQTNLVSDVPGKPARFIFATLNGVISGWNSPTVEAIAVDNSASAAYTGLTIARQNGQDT